MAGETQTGSQEATWPKPIEVWNAVSIFTVALMIVSWSGLIPNSGSVRRVRGWEISNA